MPVYAKKATRQSYLNQLDQLSFPLPNRPPDAISDQHELKQNNDEGLLDVPRLQRGKRTILVNFYSMTPCTSVLKGQEPRNLHANLEDSDSVCIIGTVSHLLPKHLAQSSTCRSKLIARKGLAQL